MDVLRRLPHFVLARADALALIYLRRTPLAFGPLIELEETFTPLEAGLGPIDRSRYALLIDARGGPMRNAPELEASFPSIGAGFSAASRKW